MKLAVLQEHLSRALTDVGRVSPQRSSLPICASVLIGSDNGRLRITGTDLKTAITRYIGMQVVTDGAIALPAKLFARAIAALPKEKIEIEVKGKTATFRCEAKEFSLVGEDAHDFPPVPHVDGEATEVEGQAFREAVKQVIFCAAGDDSRPVLQGILIELASGSLTLTAADSFQLGTVTIPAKGRETGEALIPAGALKEAARFAGDGAVDLRFNGNQACLSMGDTDVTAQVIQGSFPNYRQLIPDAFTTSVEVDAAALRAEVKAADLFARDGSGIIRLTVEDGSIVVAARAEAVGDYKSTIPTGGLVGEPGKVAFNGHYLLGILAVHERVTLNLNSPSELAMFSAPDSGVRHVVMPMFVQW